MNGDNINLLKDCDLELEKISKWIDSHKLDSNIKYLVPYAVIKSCGTIELILKNTLYDYLSLGSVNEAKNYFHKYIIEASFNPSPDKINQLLKSMNPDWNKEFNTKTKASADKEKLQSLINLRNDFAHGLSISVSISDVIEYYESAKIIITSIDQIINPS